MSVDRFVEQARNELTEAMKRLESLEQEKARVNLEIERIRTYTELVKKVIDFYEAGGAEAKPSPLFPPDITVGPNEFRHLSIADAAEAVLKKATQPIHGRVILNYLRQGGKVFGGSTPMASLYSVLTRDSRFLNLGENVWTLRKK